jgi:hypothetical protein
MLPLLESILSGFSRELSEQPSVDETASPASYFQRTASLSGNVLPATPVSAELPRNIGQSGPVAGARVGRDAGSVVGRVSLC